MVPEGWTEGKVGDLLKGLESGVSVNGTDRPLKPGEKGVLKVSAVSYGCFNSHAAKAVVHEDLSRVRTSPKANQIIISRSNTANLVGASAYIHQDHPDLFLSDKLWQTIPRAKVNTEWLAYFLASDYSRYTLSRLATGTSGSMKNITKSELLGLSVLIPPCDEQREIAKILSTWDEAISVTEKLLSNSERQKKDLMQKLLTGKNRLQEFKGKEWEERTLGSLFSERKESGVIDLPLLSVTSNNGIINRDDVGRKDISSSDKSKYLRVCPGDIAYNTMRMWQGVSALSSLDGIVSPAYTVLKPKSGVESRYAAYLFKLPIMIHRFYRHSQGLVSDTWNLKYKHFSKIKASVPKPNEQKAIADVLSKEDEAIHAIKRQIEQLRLEKSVLMQQLLTGKRRVKVKAAERATA